MTVDLTDVERQVLGALLHAQAPAADIFGVLEAEDFAPGLNRAIYAAALALHQREEPRDPTTVYGEILNQGMLNGEKRRLHLELSDMFENVGVLDSARYHASMLAGTSRRNRALAALSQATKLIKAGGEPAGVLRELAVETGVPLSAPVPSASTLLDHPPAEKPEMMTPGFIMDGGITVLAAPTKVGKTNFWLHIARLLTTGGDWQELFGATEPMPVLMIQLELSEATMHKRLETLVADPEFGWPREALERFYVKCVRSLLLDRRDGVERVMKVIAGCKERPKVVILDSYNAAVAGDPDKSDEARRALHTLREVQERLGVAWCITAEIRKGPPGQRIRYTIDDLKGSNELAYDADTVLMLRPTDEHRKVLGMHFLAMRHATADIPDDYTLERNGLRFHIGVGKPASASNENEGAAEAILRDHYAAGARANWRWDLQLVKTSGVEIGSTAFQRVWARLRDEREGR